MRQMSEIRAALFDGDGVTILPSAPFSVQYAIQQGLDPKVLDSFTFGDFQQAMVGKADLLENHRGIWRWNDPVDELIQLWCEAENHPNVPLVELIKELRGHCRSRWWIIQSFLLTS